MNLPLRGKLMNILYIDHYAGSPEMGMEFRPYYLSREWLKMGHSVRIVAADFSHLRMKNPDVYRDFQETKADGITYTWIRAGTYQGNGVARALTMLRFVGKLWRNAKRIAREWKPDVVITSSTYPVDTWAGQRIRKFSGATLIHEVHDMWPATLIEIGGMSKWNPFVVLMQFGENYAYRHADAVVSLPKYAEAYMTQHGLRTGRFHCIPNGVVVEDWLNPLPLPEEHERILQKLSDEGKFVVGYFGGHALSNCLMPLLQSAEQMQNDAVHFVLVGDGVEKNDLIQYAKRLNNVTFLPPIPKRSIPTLTKYFACTYIGAKDSPLYRFGVCMNKMFDCMMAGKPVILAINAPPTPIDDVACGLTVKPECPEAVNYAIRELMAMTREQRDEMGKRGRAEIIRNYTYEELARDFISVMK